MISVFGFVELTNSTNVRTYVTTKVALRRDCSRESPMYNFQCKEERRACRLSIQLALHHRRSRRVFAGALTSPGDHRFLHFQPCSPFLRRNPSLPFFFTSAVFHSESPRLLLIRPLPLFFSTSDLIQRSNIPVFKLVIA